MYLSGRTQMLSHYALEESLEVIHRLGYQGAEICVERMDWSRHDFDRGRMRALRRRCESLGFRGWSFSLHGDYIYDRDTLARTLECIALTPDLGTDTFVFSGTWAREDDPDPWARVVAATRELVAVAEKHGVRLALETEPGFIVGDTATLLRLIEEIDSPFLGANLDIGHMFLCDPDPFAAMEQIADRIFHVHFENMPAGIHRHLPPDDPQGGMDIPAYLRKLHDCSYDGPLAFDLYRDDYEQVSVGAVGYVGRLLAGMTAE